MFGRQVKFLYVPGSQRTCDDSSYRGCLALSSASRQRSQLYDSNCDGVLDFDEFSEGITMCQLDHLFPRSLQRTLFDKIDTDKVGAFLGRCVNRYFARSTVLNECYFHGIVFSFQCSPIWNAHDTCIRIAFAVGYPDHFVPGSFCWWYSSNVSRSCRALEATHPHVFLRYLNSALADCLSCFDRLHPSRAV